MAKKNFAICTNIVYDIRSGYLKLTSGLVTVGGGWGGGGTGVPIRTRGQTLWFKCTLFGIKTAALASFLSRFGLCQLSKPHCTVRELLPGKSTFMKTTRQVDRFLVKVFVRAAHKVYVSHWRKSKDFTRLSQYVLFKCFAIISKKFTAIILILYDIEYQSQNRQVYEDPLPLKQL